MTKNFKRILVIRFSSLGDIVLLTPLFREIKKFIPEAGVDFLTSTTFGDICGNNPYIDQIIRLDRRKGFEELSRVKRRLMQNRYDLILDAHQSIRSRLLLSLMHGPFYRKKRNIICIDKRSIKRNILLSTGINLFKEPIAQREAYCNLITRFSDPDLIDASTALFPAEKENDRIDEILHSRRLDGENLVAFGPGSSFPGKSWPKEYYLELAELLYEEEYKIILLGGASEIEPKWISETSKYELHNLSGQLSFLESAELLKHCRLSVSNDTAVVHLAEAVGVPAISIFGPTVKEFGYSPFLKDSRRLEIQLKCRPCSRNGKGKCHNRIQRQCLRDLSVKTVFEAALQILN